MPSFGFIGWFGGFSVAPCLVLVAGAQSAASRISTRHSWSLASFRCCWLDRPLRSPIGPPLRRAMRLIRVWVRCRRISVMPAIYHVSCCVMPTLNHGLCPAGPLPCVMSCLPLCHMSCLTTSSAMPHVMLPFHYSSPPPAKCHVVLSLHHVLHHIVTFNICELVGARAGRLLR